MVGFTPAMTALGARTRLGGSPVAPGDVLARKYRVDAMVGEGGTGVVVAATHLSLERKVAIKILRTALASEEIRVRFEREAEAIERIASEHVVLVYDVGTLPDGATFMVMEYLEGRDLSRVLREDGPLGVTEAVDCMLQVCEALAVAHAASVVHRDLKPANLFLTRRANGSPCMKIVDFGISKLLRSASSEGPARAEMTSVDSLLGSPRYMAPEQLRSSKDVDARADLWSVGCVLHQLLSGAHPFATASAAESIVRIMSGTADPLRPVAPDVPPELEAVIQRALQNDPAARWQSARELAAALRPFASSRVRDELDREADGEPSVRLRSNSVHVPWSEALATPSEAARAMTQAEPRRRARPVFAAFAVALVLGAVAVAVLVARSSLPADLRGRLRAVSLDAGPRAP